MIDLVEKGLAHIKYLRKRRVIAPLEKKLDKDFRQAFQKQKSIFLSRFETLRSEFQEADIQTTLDSVFGPAFDETESLMTGSIEEAAEAAITAAYKHRSVEAGISYAFNKQNRKAIAYLKRHAAESVSQINETTRDEISRIIVKGQEAGWSYDKTARAISKKFSDFAIGRPQAHIDSRAHLVAVTEAAEAYEDGSRLVVDEITAAGIEMEMRWSNVGDLRVSDGCLENSAAGWIPVTSTFPSGHKHSPRFPGCRCTILYRRKVPT